MKKFKTINTIKNITLIIGVIAFLLSAIAINSDNWALIIVLAVIAAGSIAMGAFIERMLVIYNSRTIKNYTPIFYFNNINKKVIYQYEQWLRETGARDTNGNFLSFCSRRGYM